MQRSPASIEVFDTALQFVESAAESGNDDALALADDLYVRLDGLVAAVSPYAEGGVHAARDVQQKLNDRVVFLRRNHDWMHNQHVMAMLYYYRNEGSAVPAGDKLSALAQYDEGRFAPYVARRFEEEWQHWPDALSSEEQKIEAARQRVLKGSQP